MTRVLLVDDDERLANVIEDWLVGESYIVEYTNNGKDGCEKARSNTHEVLILDWQMPGKTGVEICREYRQNGGIGVVVMLTGKTTISDKEEGLDSGADDYITKPFHPRELSARLRALLRRPRAMQAEVFRAGDITLEPKSCRVLKGDKEINFLPKEFALLEFLMRNPNVVFSADELLNKVWSKESENSPDTVRVHITKIRGKIDSPDQESLIRTVHRVGYKLHAPVE
jgi:two-component system copper resistance phosphate regulon response regulator CusR